MNYMVVIMHYKQVEGTCCEFECLQGVEVISIFNYGCYVIQPNCIIHVYKLTIRVFRITLDNGLSDKTEFALLFSLSTGLVVLLIILVLVTE